MALNKTVNEINADCDKTQDFILKCENEFDESLNAVVNEFLSDCEYDIVLLAGPSSSGKTTTAGKIAQKIKEKNRNAYTVSLDDFYLDRDNIPLDSNGLRDFETVYSLDLDCLHKTFRDLIEKRKAELPVFDFLTGTRKTQTNHIELEKNDVIIVEGIHALNPLITAGLGENHIFRIYISVSSRVVDNSGKTLLSKRDLRLIRRIVRDYGHRGTSPENTFVQWPSVLSGEDKYLFPYELNADRKINSFHAYEPCMFRKRAVDLLSAIEPDSLHYEKAQYLINQLVLFKEIPVSLLPEDSLLVEFLG